METLNVLKIIKKKAYLIQEDKLDSYRNYSINGIKIEDEQKKGQIILLFTDNLEFTSNSDNLIYYMNKETIMSVEEFKSKPTRYDSGDSDEHTLHCIANRKELKGFKPVYEDAKPEHVELNVIGIIENTESKFIHVTISGKWSKHPVLYTIYGSRVAVDEYDKLASEYETHAKFSVRTRSYLEYNKINNKYVFGKCYPFGDYGYEKNFTNLNQAMGEEKEIRDLVRNVVELYVFPEKTNEFTLNKILTELLLVKDIPTVKSKNQGICAVIKGIRNHIKKINQTEDR